MADDAYRLPNEIATELDLSPSTLRRWSNEFADFLSPPAGRPEPEPGSRMAHRRYTDQDLDVLRTVKHLLADGMTYVQVARRLEARLARPAGGMEQAGNDGPGRAAEVGTALMNWSDVAGAAPAVSVLSDTLHTVADGQQLLLGSQQANRELLSVVLQDNFSLKEENAKLRDRMLELERDMVEMRRIEESHRDKLEARLQRMEDYVRRTAAVQPPPTERPGCLAQIFGPLT